MGARLKLFRTIIGAWLRLAVVTVLPFTFNDSLGLESTIKLPPFAPFKFWSSNVPFGSTFIIFKLVLLLLLLLESTVVVCLMPLLRASCWANCCGLGRFRVKLDGFESTVTLPLTALAFALFSMFKLLANTIWGLVLPLLALLLDVGII